MRRSARGLAVLALVVVTAACGSSGTGSGSGSTKGGGDTAASLAGTDWVLSGMHPAVTIPNGVTVTAAFTGTRVTGNAGCNTYRGPYEQHGTKLTIGPDLVTTRKACPSGPSAVEQAYLQRLVRVRSVTTSGSTMAMANAAGTVILRFDAAPTGAAAIEGAWAVTSIYTGNAVETTTGPTLTAVFTADQVSGDSGCNTFNGGYTVDGTAIDIGALAATMKACADDAVMTQEQQYLQALELSKSFEVVGNGLTFFRTDGGIAVTLTRGSG